MTGTVYTSSVNQMFDCVSFTHTNMQRVTIDIRYLFNGNSNCHDSWLIPRRFPFIYSYAGNNETHREIVQTKNLIKTQITDSGSNQNHRRHWYLWNIRDREPTTTTPTTKKIHKFRIAEIVRIDTRNGNANVTCIATQKFMVNFSQSRTHIFRWAACSFAVN